MTTDDSIRTSKGLCPACGFEATDGSTICPSDGVVLIPQLVDPYIGKTLDGRYQIESVIGFGGITVVYKAVDTRLNRVVVVKMLHSELVDDHRKLQRFQRGARAASVLAHPNIVTLHDCVLTESGNCYLVMDYAEGTTLSDMIGYHGAIEVVRGIRIFSQVCDALAHAHERKIIHRNLKPSNILVSRAADGSDLVKLGDFGIAKQLVGEGDVAQKVTRTGQWVGSPLYMSPEQAQSKPVDARSDVFSLGKVMLEAFKGKLPILADSMVEVPDPTRVPDKPHPEFVDPIPAPLRQIIAKTLQKDPKARYQSMKDLKRDLDHLLGGKGKSGLSLGMRISRLTGSLGTHHRALTAFLVLVLVALVGFIGYLFYAPTPGGQIALSKMEIFTTEITSGPADSKLKSRFNHLGDLYMKEGRYKDAVEAFESAAKLISGDKGPLSREQMEIYANLSGAAQAAGDRKKAKAAAAEAIRIADILVIKEQERTGLQNLAEIMSMLSVKERLVRVTSDTDSHAYAEVLFAMGQASTESGDTRRGRKYLEQALAVAEEHPDRDKDILYWSLLELAKVYKLTGDYSKCDLALKRALAGARETYGACSAVAVSLSMALGELYFVQRELDKCIAAYRNALAAVGEDHGAGRQRYIGIVSSLAAAYRFKKDYAAGAEALLNKALASEFGKSLKPKIEIMRQLASCYALDGKFPKAEQLMTEVIALQDSSTQLDGVERFMTYRTMGEINRDHNDYEKAVLWFKKALKMYNPNSRVDELEYLAVLMQVAYCYSVDGKTADADSTFKQVMEAEEASPRADRMRLSSDAQVYVDFLKSHGHGNLARAWKTRSAQVLSNLRS